MGVQPPDSIWTEGRRAELRELWLQGLSTAEIGRRLGCTKNAVIGRARRDALPSRAAPVAFTGKEAAQERLERGKALLLEGFSVDAAASAARVHRKRLAAVRDEIGVPVYVNQFVRNRPKKLALPSCEPVVNNVVPFVSPSVPAPPAPAAVSPPPTASGAKHPCCWPIGEPGRRGFRFCGSASVPRYSYCEEHCRKAYEKWPAQKTA